MSRIWKKSVKIMLYQFRQQFFTVKSLVLFFLLFVYLNRNLRAVADFSKAVGVKVYPWFFPIITSDFLCQILLVVGGVFLFSGVPFKNENQSYLEYRSGSLGWTGGNILYMFAGSFLYVLAILLFGLINLADVLDFGMSWGKVWGTLARTDAVYQFYIPFSILDTVLKFDPVQALLYSFLLEWLCIFWLGLLMYGCNDMLGKRTGILAAAFFVFLDVMIYNAMSREVYRFSPVTLSQLGYFDGDMARYGVTLSYAFCFFGVTIFLFVAVLLCRCIPWIRHFFIRISCRQARKKETDKRILSGGEDEG